MPIKGNETLLTIQLLTAQTSSSDGVWINSRNLKTFSIHVTGLSAGDICQIRVSGASTIPANSAHAVQLGSDITAERIVSSSTNRFRWLKVRKSVGGGSSTDAYLFAEVE